jgi:hypothetical protein
LTPENPMCAKQLYSGCKIGAKQVFNIKYCKKSRCYRQV